MVMETLYLQVGDGIDQGRHIGLVCKIALTILERIINGKESGFHSSRKIRDTMDNAERWHSKCQQVNKIERMKLLALQRSFYSPVEVTLLLFFFQFIILFYFLKHKEDNLFA